MSGLECTLVAATRLVTPGIPPTIGLLCTFQSVRETTMEEIVAFPLDIANDAALSDIWNSHHSEVAANGNKLALLHGEKSGDDSVHVGLRFC